MKPSAVLSGRVVFLVGSVLVIVNGSQRRARCGLGRCRRRWRLTRSASGCARKMAWADAWTGVYMTGYDWKPEFVFYARAPDWAECTQNGVPAALGVFRNISRHDLFSSRRRTRLGSEQPSQAAAAIQRPACANAKTTAASPATLQIRS